MRCAIFAGGEIKDLSFIDVFEIRKNCNLVICADSGYNYARKLDIVPDIIVGDFDSYTENLPENVMIYRSPPEKDDTDTMLAVRTAIENGCNDICLYGALGKRFDHALANIQVLVYAYEKGCTMRIIDADNEIMVQGTGSKEYKKLDGWYFSIFSLTENALIKKYYGVKYPLYDFELEKNFPIGVSNEITENKAVLQIDSGLVLIVRSKM